MMCGGSRIMLSGGKSLTGRHARLHLNLPQTRPPVTQNKRQNDAGGDALTRCPILSLRQTQARTPNGRFAARPRAGLGGGRGGARRARRTPTKPGTTEELSRLQQQVGKSSAPLASVHSRHPSVCDQSARRCLPRRLPHISTAPTPTPPRTPS